MLIAEWLPAFSIRELSNEDNFPYFAHPQECQQIEAAGKELFRLGVMQFINKQGVNSSATHGNLAIRLRHAPFRLIMTATDSNKGMLTPNDFVEVCLDRHILYAPEGRQPSTDAALMINIFLSFPTIFWYTHFHEPVTNGFPVELTYKGLRPAEWLKLHSLLNKGIRVFNLLNHVSPYPPGTEDAAIVLGGDKKKPFCRAITVLKDSASGKHTSII